MRIPVGQFLRLVLSLILLGVGSAPRLALCLGSDGHRAIESLDATCCRPGPASSADMTDPCARSCQDLPLSVAVGIRAPERGGLTLELPATVVPGDVPCATGWTGMSSRPSNVSTASSGLAPRVRSTMLLC